ncbi:MAG: diguanylate cyclase [Pseudomonadales bacterium]|nr:diguanylate cyclase [Pseudomonadales bacterium]
MLKDTKITRKLPLVMISLALISAMATGVIAYTHTASSMHDSAKSKLISLLESRKSSLQQYFDNIQQQVSFHAKSPLIISSLGDLSRGWQQLQPDSKELLQSQYIENNPYKQGQRGSFLGPLDDSNYTEQHRNYHPIFSNMIAGSSYSDFFLVDPLGNIIYSVNKELDFASNLYRGPFKDTGIAELFRSVNKHPAEAKIQLSDFSIYTTCKQAAASFIAAPVFSEDNQYLGAVIFQLPIQPLDKIMQVTAGMGESGETYLVGSDLLMRSNSRFYKDRSILTTKVSTASVYQALQGRSGFNIIQDYRDIRVYSAYAPIDFLGLQWAILAEVDEAEVLRPVYAISRFLIISGVLIAIVISALGYLLAKDISRPIVAMTDIMKRLSRNDLEVDISVGERRDEVGKMAEAMVIFKRNAQERQQLQQELNHMSSHDVLTGVYTRKYALDHLACLLKIARIEDTKLVLMHINLDNFKAVNDIHGHQTGDKVLGGLALGLQECVREVDIIARIGGDEFIVILPNVTDLEESLNIASTILSKVHPVLPLAEKTPQLTLSIGLSVYPDDAADVDALLLHADRAMYNVKSRGKNNVEYWKQEMETDQDFFS